jgi:hypothetical protein
VLILVWLTVVITATVGLNVFVADTDDASGPQTANFSYEYIPSGSVLLISHRQGDTFHAGNLTVAGPRGNNVTWAALANSAPNETVGPGDTIQLSRQNAYGRPVSRGDDIRIYYVGVNGTRRQLSRWQDG